ncbi:MAG TPA: hypothetical protein VGL83_19110 [Stellaceae bacterium]|jgi:hypothetical protein
MGHLRTGFSLLVFVIAALLLPVSPAKADHLQTCDDGRVFVNDDLRVVCSATWQFIGTCSGQDLWDKWTVIGRTHPADAFIRPWTNAPITVIGYELVKLDGNDSDPNQRESWFMIGSTIHPQSDAMLWLAPGERHAKQIWPSGMGQIWPSKDVAFVKGKPLLLDLHGACFGGGPISIFMTIYYTPNGHFTLPKDAR